MESASKGILSKLKLRFLVMLTLYCCNKIAMGIEISLKCSEVTLVSHSVHIV